MKKSKLLIPLLSVASTAAIVAPIMTSCSQSEKDVSSNPNFIYKSGEKAKAVLSSAPTGTIDFVYEYKEATFTEKDYKAIEVNATLTQTNSYITLLKCWKGAYDKTSKQIHIYISYSIDPDGFVYKEKSEGVVADPETVKYNLTIHNGTWTQTDKDYTVSATRDAKPE